MAETPAATATELKPQVASYADIIEACDGCDATNNADDSKFVCDQQRQNATVPQAQKAWMSTLKARADAREQENADLREQQQKNEQAASTAKTKTGVQTVEDGEGANANETFTDAESEFNAAVEANIKCGMKRGNAVSKVIRQNPDLHRAMLEAHNTDQGRMVTLPAAYVG